MSTNITVGAIERNSNYPPTLALLAAQINADTYKAPVRVATNAALPAYTRVGNVLTASSVASLNTAGIDSVTTLVAGDRVLVKNGAAGADNGIYDITVLGVTATTKWVLTRSDDANDTTMVASGMRVFVSEGTVNQGLVYALTTANPITLNTTALTFSLAVTSAPAATAGAEGIVQLAGDLAGAGGTAAAPRVSGINSTTVPATPAIGQSLIAQTTTSTAWSAQPGAYHTVRGVVTAAIASLAAFTVAGNDGLTYIAGDRVLLVGQGSPAANGIYVVGTVTTGTAPLTRATDWLLAAVLPSGSTVAINAGTLWANTIWFATVAGDVTVGTTAPAFCPERYSIITAAMSGTPGVFAVSGAYILSATLSSVVPTVKVAGTQGFLSVGTLTAGLGSGSFTVTSTANETSTLYIAFRNR